SLSRLPRLCRGAPGRRRQVVPPRAGGRVHAQDRGCAGVARGLRRDLAGRRPSGRGAHASAREGVTVNRGALRPKTLLVSMPWASAGRPSLAVGVLAGALDRAGLPCETAYPCLDLCAELGAESYELFAGTPWLFPLGEHLFAVDLFGCDALRSDEYL